MQKTRQLWLNIILILVMLIVLFAFSEIILRLFTKTPTNLYRYNSDYVWEYRSNGKSFVNYQNETIEVTTDSYGFHDYEIKDKENIELALGDSMIAATYLPIDKGMIDILRERIGKNIVNSGVSGWNTEQQLLFLIKKGIKLKPKKVLLFFYIGNDISGNYYRNFSSIEDNILVKNPRKFRDSFIARAPYYWLTSNSYLFVRLENLFNNIRFGVTLPTDYQESKWCKEIGLEPTDKVLQIFLSEDSEEYDKIWLKTKEQLFFMKKLLDREGIEFEVIIVPDIIQVEEDKADIVKGCFNLTDDDIDLEKPNKELRRFFEDNDVKYYDLLPGLKGKKDLYMPNDIHFNANGHEIVAELIIQNGKE